ncbi:hypothetical protein THRCLA_22316 [Thraustotheca clavata]|uniref:DUF659 domain-containing protein n=1 Tax=Thraustotheca clavata TaxID=74557 RepID=A0A1V9Z5U1_9STRA|nr:hypothetical protein THRCLA_22316 [Thraustotheca clavata]
MTVAMAFYANGISFRVIEDPFFQATLVNNLKGKSNLAVVSDGWSNTNGDNIINFVVTSSQVSPVYWGSANASGHVHTGNYIAEIILAMVKDLESFIGVNTVTPVVTDNAANLKSAWAIITQSNSAIVCSGCVAYGMNLMIKDILSIEFFENVLEHLHQLSAFNFLVLMYGSYSSPGELDGEWPLSWTATVPPPTIATMSPQASRIFTKGVAQGQVAAAVRMLTSGVLACRINLY